MNTAIEASSFSSITSIAANPPTRPSDILQQHHESLTLYITRVPGSRDVFLTPLKPRERVVTAQDVQSSLYYVHIHAADDIDLLHRPSVAKAAEPEDVLSSVMFRPRDENEVKSGMTPSPSLPPPTLSQRAQSVPTLPARPPRISRKPVMIDVTNMSGFPPVTLPVLPPRPLPPIPDENVSPIMTTSTQNKPTGSQHSVPQKPTRPMTPVEMSAYEELAGSLTLVRREPATSDQWNVATIYDSPVHEVTSRRSSGLAKSRVKKSGAPLCIDITNPAYLAFQSRNLSTASTTTSSSSDDHPDQEGTFRRRLHLPGSSSVEYTIDAMARKDSPFSRSSIDQQTYERSSIDMRRTGYSFKSPWDGDCLFTTSTSGRALICRHTLSGEQRTNEVSELRFNLPTSLKEASLKQEGRRSYFADSKRHSRMDIVHALARLSDIKRGSKDDIENDTDEIDLGLGQEMAGGGFGGRQPKLGKLIIHPSGLAMLDLLVAANIGLWWRAWEKVG